MRAAEDKRLAEAVRRACLLAAEQATEDAGISGLCWEGRFEAALDAIRALRVDEGLISQPAAEGTDAQSVRPGGLCRE